MSTKLSASDLLFAVAEQMKNPEQVKNIVSDPKNCNPEPLSEMVYWNDLSIAGGYPGVIPLFIELDRLQPDARWDLIVHDYVLKIKESIEKRGLHSISLFGGLAGACYYLHQASKGRTRYTKILSKLDDYIIAEIKNQYIGPFKRHLETKQPVPPRLYETVQGLSGIGLYCLAASNEDKLKSVLDAIVSLLIAVTKPIQIDDITVPGWYIKCKDLFLQEERDQFQKGNFNLGLSHGITGVLAFLSMAALNGYATEGLEQAIFDIATWLQNKRKMIDERWYWDTAVSFEEQVGLKPGAQVKSRDAWCYGTPGVARSLFLSGLALSDQKLMEFATESFASVFTSTREDWNLPGPTICHGISGLLAITHLMARDTGADFFHQKTRELTGLLMSYYDIKQPVGFKNYEPQKQGGFAKIDRADLLEGATGVLLTLSMVQNGGGTWHLPLLIDHKF